MIRISKVYVVDGAEVNVSAEGGSAKEALAMVEHEAETLGPAPRTGAAAPKGSRSRRTPAEMEAARAAAGGAPTAAEPQLPLPSAAGPEPARVFTNTGPHAVYIDPAQHFSPGTQTVLPANPGPASFAPGPAASQAEKSVAFDGPPPPSNDAPPSPPPPPESEEDALRERINATMRETIALQPTWADAVKAAMHKSAERFGGSIYAMTGEGLRDVLKGVEEYQKRVREALAQRR